MVWVAEGAEVKATCHLYGHGNRSRARQAYHQVMGGREEGGDYARAGGGSSPPPQPGVGLKQGCSRTCCLRWLHGTAQQSGVTVTSCSRPAPDFQKAQRRQSTATKAKHSCRCTL